MAQRFIACDRDQGFLLPPDVREWLPEDHLVSFVIAAVLKKQIETDPACQSGRIWTERVARRTHGARRSGAPKVPLSAPEEEELEQHHPRRRDSPACWRCLESPRSHVRRGGLSRRLACVPDLPNPSAEDLALDEIDRFLDVHDEIEDVLEVQYKEVARTSRPRIG